MCLNSLRFNETGISVQKPAAAASVPAPKKRKLRRVRLRSSFAVMVRASIRSSAVSLVGFTDTPVTIERNVSQPLLTTRTTCGTAKATKTHIVQ